MADRRDRAGRDGSDGRHVRSIFLWRYQPTGRRRQRGSTSLYTVARQDLSSQTEVSATLGYADGYNVVNQAQGTVTAIPAVGQVVSQGQVLYQVSGAPVVLLYGSTPAYRTLSLGVDAEPTSPSSTPTWSRLATPRSIGATAGSDEFSLADRAGTWKGCRPLWA